MTLFDNVKGTVNTAVDTISTVAQAIVEKNRTNAKLNRLRLVMKSESELMNRAYIALGKAEYDANKKGEAVSKSECEKLVKVIDGSKVKIAKARECYRKIVDCTNDIYYGAPAASAPKSADIVDITVACSNESDYDSSPFASQPDEPCDKTREAEAQTPAQKHAATICDLKAELEARKNENLSADGDAESADDSESPDGELF